MFPSDPSIALARERYQDLLRDAERERQINALRSPARHRPAIADRVRSWRDALDLLRPLDCRTAPTACPE